MPEFIHVRVKDTGHQGPIRKSHFDLNPDAYEATKRPALGPDGEPVEWKHKTSVAKLASAKPGQQAESKKETD